MRMAEKRERERERRAGVGHQHLPRNGFVYFSRERVQSELQRCMRDSEKSSRFKISARTSKRIQYKAPPLRLDRDRVASSIALLIFYLAAFSSFSPFCRPDFLIKSAAASHYRNALHRQIKNAHSYCCGF